MFRRLRDFFSDMLRQTDLVLLALCAAAKHILEQYAHRAGELRCETGRRPRWDASLWTK